MVQAKHYRVVKREKSNSCSLKRLFKPFSCRKKIIYMLFSAGITGLLIGKCLSHKHYYR